MDAPGTRFSYVSGRVSDRPIRHTRRNGKFFLGIIGHPRFGLPFGQDRLISIRVATLAVRRKYGKVYQISFSAN